MIKQFARDNTDERFRQYACEVIRHARRDLYLLGRQIGSYRYHDFAKCIEDAKERGVTIHVYASDPEADTVNALVELGAEVFIGQELKDHLLIADEDSYVKLKPHPRGGTGVREGEVAIDETERARKELAYFKKVVSGASRKTGFSYENSPFAMALRDPPNWGVQTDSSNLEEVFFS
jgi:hypothetical protein